VVRFFVAALKDDRESRASPANSARRAAQGCRGRRRGCRNPDQDRGR